MSSEHHLLEDGICQVCQQKKKVSQLLPGRDSGAGDHDEPEPAGVQRPAVAEHDYQINLKAELEIRRQNEKIEYILNQCQGLMAMQTQQLELMEEILCSNKTI